MRLVYLIGAPGVGKTTLLDALTATWDTWGAAQWEDFPLKHRWWRDKSYQVQLGHPRKNFGGTDTWGYTEGPKALRWLLTEPAELVVGEGDRFAVAPWLTQLHATVLWCSLPAAELAIRRAKRVQALGWEQSATWIKGRETKTLNLAHATHAQPFDMSAALPVLLAELKRIVEAP